MASTLFSSSPPPPPPAPPSASPARGEVTVAELGGEFLYASPDSADYALSTAGIEVYMIYMYMYCHGWYCKCIDTEEV